MSEKKNDDLELDDNNSNASDLEFTTENENDIVLDVNEDSNDLIAKESNIKKEEQIKENISKMGKNDDSEGSTEKRNKSTKSSKKDQPSFMERKKIQFKEQVAEFHKIVWPNRKELTKMTITVIITSLLFGVIIAGMDVVFGGIIRVLNTL